MRSVQPWRACRFVMPALLSLVCFSAATAQKSYPDSLIVWMDDDSTSVVRMTKGEIFPAKAFVSGYDFQMYADSTCETDYHITAFRINGSRWKLRNWKGWRTVNTNADLLSYNSRTVETTLHAGDTITFFRTLRWKNPIEWKQDTNNYKSFDTLTFAVELVRSSGPRAALIDSIGIMPRITPGAPVIHGMRPIMADVSWVVPSSLDGVQCFLRVRVRADGSGEYDFTRTEAPTRINDGPLPPFWIDYMNYFANYFGEQFNKPAVGGSNPGTEESPLLRVLSATGAADAMAFELATAPNGGSTALAIYDGAGRLLFYPYSTPSSSSGTQRVEYRFESSGLYVIVLLHGGRPVATRTITIGR